MSAASGDEYLVADSATLLAVPESVPQSIVAKPPTAQWPFLLVAAVALGGLVLIGVGSLQQGLVGMVVAMALAALLRLMLPVTTAGWLTSRSRMVDVAGFALLAAGLGAVTLMLLR